MASLNQLETEINELLTAAKALVDHCRAAGGGLFAPASPSSTPRPAVPPEAPDDAHRARRNVLAIVTRLQMLLAEPADFIQHLACQSQLLACLKWLGEFQVLACIPLSGTVPLQDVADLAGVPEGHLLSVVRMTATAGFLHEPQPGHVAHTALSAPFVTRLTYLDAAMFLAETAAPTALKLAAATKHHGRSDKPAASAYTIAFNTSQAFNSAYEQRPKLQRQWPAYLRCTGDMDEGITEILTRLAWPSLGNACVVDVGAQSTEAARALADLYPALRFVVQLRESGPTNGMGQRRSTTPGQIEVGKPEEANPRITVQRRAAGALQTVKDAAVYILHVSGPAPGVPIHSLGEIILAELRAHLGVLRGKASAKLLLATRLLPEAGTVSADVEAMARLRDLSLLQLANEREMEMGELVEVVNSIHDGLGRLVVINKLRSRSRPTVVLGVRYQAYSDRQNGAELTVL